jgi:predicted RNA-binding Zn-ribbon protein involved in translation (DUF1610 family)
MDKKHSHHCQDKVGHVICYQEEDETTLWLESGDGFYGSVDEVTYCPFCGYSPNTKPLQIDKVCYKCKKVVIDSQGYIWKWPEGSEFVCQECGDELIENHRLSPQQSWIKDNK